MNDFDDLRPDPDEIRTYHHTHNIRSTGISIGTGIVLATIIGIGGFWGGKVGYDLLQEWRARQALEEVANYFEAQTAEQRRAEQAHQQQIQKRKIAAERARKAAIWQTRECRIWWEHAPSDPGVIAKAKSMQSCEGAL